MIVTIDLTAVPTHCWWWSGLTLYLMLSWLLLGPLLSRHIYKTSPEYYKKCAKLDCFILWALAPLTVPVVLLLALLEGIFMVLSLPLRRPICWLIYGSSK